MPLSEKREHEGVNWALLENISGRPVNDDASFGDWLRCIDPLTVFEMRLIVAFRIECPLVVCSCPKLATSPPKTFPSLLIAPLPDVVTALASYRAGVLGSMIRPVNDFV